MASESTVNPALSESGQEVVTDQACDCTENSAVSEFGQEIATDQMKDPNPRTLQTSDKMDPKPGKFGVSKFSKNIYSQGLINISLLSANATQLRRAQSNNDYEHQTALIGLISASILLQAFILLLLSLLTMVPQNCEKRHLSCVWRFLLKTRIKSVLLFSVSILTAVNVFISVYQNVGQ